MPIESENLVAIAATSGFLCWIGCIAESFKNPETPRRLEKSLALAVVRLHYQTPDPTYKLMKPSEDQPSNGKAVSVTLAAVNQKSRPGTEAWAKSSY